jgi:iron complex outermembrane receptor protein
MPAQGRRFYYALSPTAFPSHFLTIKIKKMKRIAIPIILLLLTQVGAAQNKAGSQKPSSDSFYTLSPVEVKAVRASETAPFTRTNLDKQAINRVNLGQDIPFLLNQTPGVVINSDAGNGVGYTGIRIRGSDATRINVTLNGIPYNDAESQGTFFVDLPDMASSTSSIQVQRGVGTSSNGTGSFGGSINFSTNEVNKAAYAEINNAAGSFNTWKHTLKAGTGLLNDHFTIDARLSNVSSDGYIDRASSSLRSYYLSGAFIAKNTTFRFNTFSGNEKTYQAWNGISEADLKAGNRTINSAGTEKPGEPYKNETDNYRQDHYQLFFDQKLTEHLHFNTAFFLTKGRGYYEQYKADENYADYGLINSGTTDLVRRLWLDNDYYGNIFSLQYNGEKSEATFGGSITQYDGQHFGEVIWAANGMPAPTRRWYDHDAVKKDLTVYIKEEYKLNNSFRFFGDLQFRHASHRINGFRDNPGIIIDQHFNFFNPKAGISYRKNGWNAYLSYAHAGKEPIRDDFEAAVTDLPVPEQMHDVELGVGQTGKSFHWGATLYYMLYKNQLILTGKINDVGAYTRTNIKDSYRAGIELEGSVIFNSRFNASANISFSKNKLKTFPEYLDDYDNGGQLLINHSKSDIAFSPSVVGSSVINVIPVRNAVLSLITKYVSDQYLDNTSNDTRKLDAFLTNDLRASYSFHCRHLRNVTLIATINNLFDVKYEPSGYSFSYIYGGGPVTENYYFPMAGRNVMAGINLTL